MPRLGVALLFVTLVVGIAGCGSSDDGTTGVADAPTAVSTPDSAASDATPTTTPPATDSAPATTPAATTSSGGVSTDSAGDGSPSSASGGASVDGATAPACTSGVLAASLDFTGGGAAGSTTGNLVLRNTSNASCSLYGYPGVSFVGSSGNQLGAAAGRSGGTARSITVRAGDSAFAQLKITDALNYDASSCSPVDATGLRIYPPGEKAALFVNHAVKACSKDVQLLTVGPMSTD